MGGKTGNTLQSHRLVEWANSIGGLEAQARVIEVLFQGYFEQSQDITDINFLTSVAKNAGLDENAAKTFLEGTQGVQDVKADAQNWRNNYQISGVPYFIFNDKTTVSGG